MNGATRVLAGKRFTASDDGRADDENKATIERVLELEEIDENIFRSYVQPAATPRIYGGQVIAQAIHAAGLTVDPSFNVHSIHCYFLRPGNVTLPVTFLVARTRDGNRFASRGIKAQQRGRIIFHMMASFHQAEPGLEHQVRMPWAPQPEDLKSQEDHFREHLQNVDLPKGVRQYMKYRLESVPFHIDYREVTPRTPLFPDPTPPKQMVWVRVKGDLGEPVGKNLLVHQAALSYASDASLISTALQPHGLSYADRRLTAASLDHSMWFHEPFRADEWLLFVMDSPKASGARSLILGHFFTRDGRLVCSVSQEGLMRVTQDRLDETTRSPTEPQSLQNAAVTAGGPVSKL